MIQYVIEHPTELIDYISSINTDNDLNVRLKSINLEHTNVLINCTTIPSVLIDIISSYANDEINICIKQHIINATNYYGYHNNHYQSVEMNYDFFTNNINNHNSCDFREYSFQFNCCIYFERLHFKQLDNNNRKDILKYKSLLHHQFIANDVIECDISNRMNDFENSNCYTHASSFLRKIFDNSNKYFYFAENKFKNNFKNKTFDNEQHNYDKYCRWYLFDKNMIFDEKLFFNCYSENTQQYYNKINNNLSSIDTNKNEDCKEDCKYDKDNDCYRQVKINGHSANLAQYKIKNYDKLTNIIAINKILYEFVNKYFKQLCDDRAKLEQLISNHRSAK